MPSAISVCTLLARIARSTLPGWRERARRFGNHGALDARRRGFGSRMKRASKVGQRFALRHGARCADRSSRRSDGRRSAREIGREDRGVPAEAREEFRARSCRPPSPRNAASAIGWRQGSRSGSMRHGPAVAQPSEPRWRRIGASLPAPARGERAQGDQRKGAAAGEVEPSWEALSAVGFTLSKRRALNTPRSDPHLTVCAALNRGRATDAKAAIRGP